MQLLSAEQHPDVSMKLSTGRFPLPCYDDQKPKCCLFLTLMQHVDMLHETCKKIITRNFRVCTFQNTQPFQNRTSTLEMACIWNSHFFLGNPWFFMLKLFHVAQHNVWNPRCFHVKSSRIFWSLYASHFASNWSFLKSLSVLKSTESEVSSYDFFTCLMQHVDMLRESQK